MNQENNNINNTNNNNPSVGTNPTNPVQVPVQPVTQETNQVSGSDVKVEGPRVVTPSVQSSINPAAYNMDNKEKKVNQASNNKPKGVSFGLILFMLLLVLFVVFLPEISNMIDQYRNRVVEKEIHDGQLRCELTDRSSKFTITSERNFKFKNDMVTSYSFTTTTKGDSKKDEDELTELYDQCNLLDKYVNGNQVDGVEIGCEFLEGTVTQRESVDLYSVDMDEFKTSYSEAGGTMPVDVASGDNIDNIQTQMQAEKFTCTKVS